MLENKVPWNIVDTERDEISGNEEDPVIQESMHSIHQILMIIVYPVHPIL